MAAARHLNAYTEALFHSTETILAADKIRRLLRLYGEKDVAVPVDLETIAISLGINTSRMR